MATNFTQFTSEATPSGDIVLVWHNIAGTGEIKTTISQILSAMNLATSSDATFNKVTVTTDIDLSDGANITSDGNLTLVADSNEMLVQAGFATYVQEVDLSANNTTLGAIQLKCAGNEFLRFFGGSGWGTQRLNVQAAGGLSVSGTRKTLSLGTDVFLTRDSAGVLQLGSTYQGVDGTIQLSDIILSDGSTITVGGGTGTVTVDGDIVADANIDFTGLPTSDPASAGRLYVDSSAGHVIKVSQG